MTTKNPKSIKSLLLSEHTSLADLSKRAEDHQTLLVRVCDALPENLRIHVFAADIDSGVLTVVCDSASWATRIRFYSQTLLEILVAHHKFVISQVTVKVRPRWQV